MTKVKPIFVSAPNPVGLDKVVAELQPIIAEAFFINKDSLGELYFDQGLLLPLALKDEQTQRPIIYRKGNDYFPADPNDNYRITSFFYQEDPDSLEVFNEARYKLNLVVWFNQDKYVRNQGYQIKEFLITEIKVLLRNFLRTEDVPSIEVFRELDSVFSNYTLTPEDKTRLKYPYQAFRIKFNFAAELDCGDDAKLKLPLSSVISPEVQAMLDVYEAVGVALTGIERTVMISYVDAEVASGNHVLKDYETIYSLAGVNALVDYIGGKVATAVNAPTQDINGFTTDGATNYIDSNFNPFTDGVNYQQTDALISAFLKTANPAITGNIWGSFFTPRRIRMVYVGGSNNMSTGLNSVNNDNHVGTTLIDTLQTLSRIDNTNISWHQKGVLQQIYAQATNGIPNGNILVGARNNGGTANPSLVGTLSHFMVAKGIGFNHAGSNTNLKALLIGLGQTIP